MGKSFEDLTKEELWQLRQEIVVNSVFTAHYTNSFGFNASDICTFFDGYYYYLWELANEDYDDCLVTDGLLYEQYDNQDNLDFKPFKMEVEQQPDEISLKEIKLKKKKIKLYYFI